MSGAPHTHAQPGTQPIAESAAVTRRITLYSVAVAVLLIAMKGAAWAASGSVAMLSSLADSGLDLVASLVTFYAVRYAAVPPDAEHSFGHGKAEAFASLCQAALVFASAALIGREAVVRISDPQPIAHGAAAVLVMIGSILLTGLLVAAQNRALRKTGSVAVAGDRAHYLSDLAANVATIAGVAGAAFLGMPVLDAVAGLLVALWLVWGAVQVLREASNHLMDTSLSPEAQARIVELATGAPGVSGVHQLRTRVAGPYVLMQMHADLDPQLTLEAAHAILVEAERRILAEFPAADIIIHPDPRGRAEPHGGAFHETAAIHKAKTSSRM